MKIIIYTTTDCQFSKQEKEYLLSHNLPYDEKNIETNREFLTEMLAVGNNFAGTPVTKIEKDDGTIVVLKGFTLDEFNTTLALTPSPVQKQPEPVIPAVPVTQPAPEPVAPPSEPVPSMPPAPMPVVEETPVVVPPPVPPPPVEPAPAPVNDQLNSILNDLQKKAETTAADPTQQPMPSTPPPPSIIEPQQPMDQTSNNQTTNPPSMPSIPDFKQN